MQDITKDVNRANGGDPNRGQIDEFREHRIGEVGPLPGGKAAYNMEQTPSVHEG